MFDDSFPLPLTTPFTRCAYDPAVDPCPRCGAWLWEIAHRFSLRPGTEPVRTRHGMLIPNSLDLDSVARCRECAYTVTTAGGGGA